MNLLITPKEQILAELQNIDSFLNIIIRPTDSNLSDKAVFDTVISMRHCFLAHNIKRR